MADDITKETAEAVAEILAENGRRNAAISRKFNPITGEGSVLYEDRKKAAIDDFPIPVQYLPASMMKVPLVRRILKAKTIRAFIETVLRKEYTKEDALKVVEQFVRVRFRHDYAFWAAMTAYIKNKGGGDDILFKLNRPQRKLVGRLERLRLAGLPIRLVLLKARQWGGSTCIQLYMAWLQLVHRKGLNSLIVAHLGTASDEIEDMFKRMIDSYPVSYLHEMDEIYKDDEPKFVRVGKSGNIHRVPQRNCKIKIGTAESPDSARGGDYSLVHCSEVGLWKKTDGKSPSQIVRSACSGVLLRRDTMIVYESTANGTGNFFHEEYDAARMGRSQMEAMFVPWYEIEIYSKAVDDPAAFAERLYAGRENRDVSSNREVSGRYLWWLWKKGATLEAVFWYIGERAKYSSDEDMASEYPSDDVEAFANSGARVFDRYRLEELKKSCRPPKYIGDISADGDEGEEALRNIRFTEDRQGMMWIWAMPEIDPDIEITDRYAVAVDIGGRGRKADWSVITVFDRLFQMEGGKPVVVAQWYGHTDMDILAWKAAQTAAFYDNALLIIESNTLETHDRDRRVDGDQSAYILSCIKEVYGNLYARRQSEEDIRNQAPRKYGFHTNVSTKPKIISGLIRIIRDNLYVERDERCIWEYLTYEQRQNGSYGAIPGKHDDLLMTRGIGLFVCFNEMPLPQERKRTCRTDLKKPLDRKAVSEASIT